MYQRTHSRGGDANFPRAEKVQKSTLLETSYYMTPLPSDLQSSSQRNTQRRVLNAYSFSLDEWVQLLFLILTLILTLMWALFFFFHDFCGNFWKSSHCLGEKIRKRNPHSLAVRRCLWRHWDSVIWTSSTLTANPDQILALSCVPTTCLVCSSFSK